MIFEKRQVELSICNCCPVEKATFSLFILQIGMLSLGLIFWLKLLLFGSSNANGTYKDDKF